MDEQRFVDLWRRAGSRLGQEVARRLYREMLDHYREPHRRYHTPEHIEYCLRQVDRIPDDYPHKDAVELAIWFHDVIYRIGDPENEQNSAEWFRQRADGDLPDDLVDRVCRLIVATEHRTPPDGADAAYVVDIDLSSFGRPFDEFIADSARVRAESTHLTDEEYYAGQHVFLNALLSRERVFQSDLFHELFEDQARRNIRHTLDANGGDHD